MSKTGTCTIQLSEYLELIELAKSYKLLCDEIKRDGAEVILEYGMVYYSPHAVCIKNPNEATRLLMDKISELKDQIRTLKARNEEIKKPKPFKLFSFFK
jgi:hypothetical protein